MKKRNVVLTILFITWTVCYMDRMVMTVAIPFIAKDFNLTPTSMGVLMSAFFAGYALFQIPGGMLADKFGGKKVMAIAVTWWSIFTVFTGMAANLTTMLVTRVLFGIGEASFPGGSWKTISNWFPKKERATANAVMVASNSLGPAVAPLFVVGVMSAFGWRQVFYFLFIPGLICAALIWHYCKDNPADNKLISAEELKEIQYKDDYELSTTKKLKFKDVLKNPVVWKLFFTWFAFDIVFWGFASWIPSYLVAARGFQLVKMGIIASLPFFAGTVGSVLGGIISDK
jgi:sugar phosphate permease